jgi:hypothetical protein
MSTSGRVFEPIEIDEHLTEEQIALLAKRLHQVIEGGYGYVMITITNHHVNKILRQYEEKMPLPKRDVS